MGNTLTTDKRIVVISALVEGMSMCAISRMTGIHGDTVSRLAVKVGEGCAKLMDRKMRNLTCDNFQLDEIWGFIGKKQKHLSENDDPTKGDVWTFCAIDAETKLVPCFKVGKRSAINTNEFVSDLASRLNGRVQISADGLKAYTEAIENAFGADVDYAQVIKSYAHDSAINPERTYSAAAFVGTEKIHISGRPNMELASTSYVERLNGTTRLHMRRLTRLTHAFSKKLENFEAAVALHFAYYNFVRTHGSLKMTPAMAAGVERSFWSVGDLIEAAL